ncbi:MAG: acyl-CoA synthetase [Solirubrobacterales bacterium]|nr:acyl-CoA synthetase [Solirubrobacterales bacterium]
MTLLPAVARNPDREAVRFGDRALTYAELGGASADVAARLAGAACAAVWAEPSLETCVAVVGALSAGVPAVPINPKAGERELAHIVRDSQPDVVLAAPSAGLAPQLAELPRLAVEFAAQPEVDSPAPGYPFQNPEAAALGGRAENPEAPALVIYTSGTTGPPKGAVLPRRAIASTLDALAEAWLWTERDVLVHALPLFHVHGLVLGVLGPLRLGGTLHHLGTFSVDGVAAALAGAGTMLFGVPTMYHRLAQAAEAQEEVSAGLRRARLLVSGSAPLSAADHDRLARATRQRIVERYGMTETLMICSVRANGDRRPGTVGPPLPGVELRLVDDGGAVIEASDGESLGEIHVRGPNLFLEYLNRPNATAEAFRDGWFATGDIATREPDGYIRLIGRRATDLIKSGGFKIGAGEIEAALLDHAGVAEAAVTGEADADLGECIVAWVVPADDPPPTDQELRAHVARLLAPHKRPHLVRYLEALPRNEMGKVMKTALQVPAAR